MGQYNLDRIFRPRQIAVVGASETAGSIGNALMCNLLKGGFSGTVFPVNPNYRILHGQPASKSISSLADGIDLAIIATPIHTVPDIVAECVEKKLGGAVIISAGGKETGPQGRAIEEKIHQIAHPGGLRIVGPNCMGIICSGVKLNASFAADMTETGNLAFVSQSGAICGAILDMAFKENIGFSHFVSVGSMLDVDFGDMIDYLGNDSATQSILLYIESLTNFRKFMSAARAVSRIKPIIVLKAGRSPSGARAAASHTGAMAGEDMVYDAAFKRAGIVRVDTIQELFDCAELVAKQPRPRGPRLAIITNGGGPGVMATDALARYGQEPAPLDSQTLQKLDALLPPFWSRSNPVDMLGDASAQRFRETLDVCLDAPDMDGILIIFIPQALNDPALVAREVVSAMKGRRYPVFTCWMGGKQIERALEILNENRIPTYETPERAIRAFMFMVAYSANQEALLEIPPRSNRNLSPDFQHAERLFAQAPRDGFLSEPDAMNVLSAYGIPVIPSETAMTADNAVRLAENMGYPLVMKLFSPDITHKTDADGIRLALLSEADVRIAFEQIMTSARSYNPDARIEGVTLQPFVSNPDYEILLGAKKDPNFGPVILFGTGGIFTEILKDRAIGLPPMNRLLARRLMQGTKIWSMLTGYRNRPPADMALLEEMIVRLSQLLIDFPQIAELDMNPILIKDGRPMAVDARIRVSAQYRPSPMHLVIAPYPEAEESHVTTQDGTRLFIRPIKPEDAPLFMDLFRALSPTSIYYRFFGALKAITPQMLDRFTQIDYDREIALIALEEEAGTERMLGVARIIGDLDKKEGEFAVLVGDAWHGRGIGSGLLAKCLSIAQKRGFQVVRGQVLSENTGMLAMGRKLGFQIKRNLDSREYDLVIHLCPGQQLI